MLEKQKVILEKVADAIPNMTEFEKGYLTCLVETRSKEEKGKHNGKDVVFAVAEGR